MTLLGAGPSGPRAGEKARYAPPKRAQLGAMGWLRQGGAWPLPERPRSKVALGKELPLCPGAIAGQVAPVGLRQPSSGRGLRPHSECFRQMNPQPRGRGRNAGREPGLLNAAPDFP